MIDGSPNPADRRLRCSRCGTEQSSDAANCMMCGAPIGGGGAALAVADRAGATARQAPSRKMAAVPSERTEPHHRVAPLVVDSGACSESFVVRAIATAVMGLVAIVSLVIGIRMSLDLRHDSAARERVEADVRALSRRIEDRRKRTGLYPDAATWQEWTANGGAPFLDPWGRPYDYRLEAKSYAVSTLGADGVTGESGEDEDRTFVFRHSIEERVAPRR